MSWQLTPADLAIFSRRVSTSPCRMNSARAAFIILVMEVDSISVLPIAIVIAHAHCKSSLMIMLDAPGRHALAFLFQMRLANRSCRTHCNTAYPDSKTVYPRR